ncbi:MAG: branched-chain amino acid ABC transporter substrate-binding protein [Rhizobiales bacterium]|nr:branched-chain amino acid ABC transporter substrate-binding protein [Hyphomicrobiales bacterium]NRB13156.1 branched-chain amino acid ABC transporter substrate-binding protein [Hyphomicrobiales bacterium]
MKNIMKTMSVISAIALMSGTAMAEIKIGSAGPFSGQYASFGEQLSRGAEAAVADINAAGGVLGEQLSLSLGDDRCDPKEAVNVANKFVNEGVVFVAGHFCSSSSIPASKVYDEEGILMITPASTNPKLTDDLSDYVFRVCGRDDQQGDVAGAYLQTKYAGKKVAIAHDKQGYSKGLADLTKAAFEAAGGTVALYETVNPGESDYTAFVTKLKAAGVDVLYYGGYHTELGLISRQMEDQGLDIDIVSGDALATAEFWSITGDAGEGVRFTFAPDPRKNPAAADLVAKFNAEGYDPEGYTLYSYAAIQIWAAAVKKAGTTEGAAVSAALHDGSSYDSVIGALSFDAKGDRTTADYTWYTWTDGNYVED